MSNLLWDAFVVATIIIFAGGWYVADDILGTAVRAFFYKLTHREGWPEGEKKGFIVGKKTSERLWPIIIVGSLWLYLFNGLFAATPVGIILLFFVALLATAAGFMAGPRFCSVYRRRDKVLAVIDQIENGEIDFTGEAAALAERAKGRVTELATDATGKVSTALSDALAEAKKHIHPPEPPAEESEYSAFSEMNGDYANSADLSPEEAAAEEAAAIEKAREELHRKI